jgi:hypothetical protein
VFDSDTKALGCVILLICLAGLLLFGGCTGCSAVCSNIEYSDGYRDGIIDKLSQKGVIWKTWEGVMILGGLQFNQDGSGGGALTNRLFRFSVNDAEVIKQLENLAPGARVRLHYSQKLSTFPTKGETSYFATKVEVLK